MARPTRSAPIAPSSRRRSTSPVAADRRKVVVMTMQHDSSNDSGSRLYSPREAAEFLGVSVDTLARWRVLGSGPAFVKFSRAKQAVVRYRREDLERFVGAHVHTSTSS